MRFVAETGGGMFAFHRLFLQRIIRRTPYTREPEGFAGEEHGGFQGSATRWGGSGFVMETVRFELMTSCLQGRRSPN